MPGSLEVLERANTRPDGGGSGGDGDKEAKKERRTFHCLLCQSGSVIITAKSPSYHSTSLSVYCTRCCPVELLLRTFFNHCQKSDVGCDWHHAKLVAGNFPLHPLALKYAPLSTTWSLSNAQGHHSMSRKNTKEIYRLLSRGKARQCDNPITLSYFDYRRFVGMWTRSVRKWLENWVSRTRSNQFCLRALRDVRAFDVSIEISAVLLAAVAVK